jgi:hypothetical protein
MTICPIRMRSLRPLIAIVVIMIAPAEN